MEIKGAKTVLMVGIAGSGMRGLAYLLVETGKLVIGTDRDGSELESFPEKHRYTLVDEKSAAESLKDIDVVVLTDAVSEDHLIIKEAKKKGVEILFYHEALAQLASQYKVIAVAGTHGKTSTSAMISHIMVGQGLDPSVLLGASMKEWGNISARLGKGEYFVVEADEYRNHFMQLRPAIIVITSIDYDHADFFPSLDAVRASFSKFIGNMRKGGRVIVGRKTYEEHRKINWQKNIIIVEEPSKDLKMNIYGQHMRQNAALAMKVGEIVGLQRSKMMGHINNFGGVGRRMEELGSYKGMLLISDYGHHPVEIVATVKSFREKYKDKRVVVIFEAHTLKRLITFKNDFIKALTAVDGIVLAPVFVPPGREKENEDAKKYIALFGKELKGKNKRVWVMDSFKNLQSMLDEVSDEFDVVLAFTAGDADRYLREIANEKK